MLLSKILQQQNVAAINQTFISCKIDEEEGIDMILKVLCAYKIK